MNSLLIIGFAIASVFAIGGVGASIMMDESGYWTGQGHGMMENKGMMDGDHDHEGCQMYEEGQEHNPEDCQMHGQEGRGHGHNHEECEGHMEEVPIE